MPRHLTFSNSSCIMLTNVVFDSFDFHVLHSFIDPCLIHFSIGIIILFFVGLIEPDLKTYISQIHIFFAKLRLWILLLCKFLFSSSCCAITVEVFLFYTLVRTENAQAVFWNAHDRSRIQITNYTVLWALSLTSCCGQWRPSQYSKNL